MNFTKFININGRNSKLNRLRRLLFASFIFYLGIFFQGCFLFNGSGSSEDSTKEEIDEGYGADFGEMQLLSEAIRSYDAERYSISRNLFDKLIGKYPSSPLSVFAELKVADSVFYADKFIESVPFYREFMRVHTSHEAIPYAEYQIAQAYFHAYQGLSHDVTPIREARKSFSNVVQKYPDSTWSVFAEEQILECDKLLFSSEMNVIEFYKKRGMETAARARLKTAKSIYSHLDEHESVKEELPDNLNITTKAVEEINMSEELTVKNIFSTEEYEFLRSISCDSNEHISRLVLYFNTKPYVFSSRQRSTSGENKSKKYENSILIQSHATFDFHSSDFQTLDSGNSIIREFESCGSSLDQIKVDEVISNSSNDFNELEGYVSVKLSSIRDRKVKILSFSDPERMILIFE
jgi:outer membrane assembly lipoprotein YfiO